MTDQLNFSLVAAAIVNVAILTGAAGLRTTVAQDAAEYSDQSAEFYVRQLSDDDVEVRRRAAYVLGRINAPADVAVPALAKALSDGQMETRWYAIDALGHFGAEAASAVPEIIKSLNSSLNDATVRRRGARSLGRIGAAADAAAPVLEAALDSEDALYRIAAAEALWRINRHARSLPLLAEMATSDDSDVAFAAVIALSQLPTADSQTLPPLLKALTYDDPDVRQAAVAGLVNLGAIAIETLSRFVASSQPIGREDAARALGMIIDRSRRDVLYDDTISESQFTKAAVPLIRTALPALAKLLDSEDESLQQAAVLALAQGGSLAVPQLLNNLTTGNAQSREQAAQALVRLESYLPKQRPLPANVARVHRRIVDLLVAALENDDPTVQAASVRLFVALEVGPDGSAAEPHLRRALTTGDLATRRYADKALQRIQPQP